MYKNLFKGIFDRVLAAILLLLFSPILLVCAYQIRKHLGSPIFFRQERPGKNGKIFRIFKFRTMSDARDKDGNLLPDSERLGGVGAKIRALSLDELPQLLNVLRGEMSFVGPRPLLVEYLPLYSSEQARRHEVLPGITGLAQVNGRNAISWEDKFRFDVEYVDNISFALDMKILFLTVKKVLIRDGITAHNSVSAEKFMGRQIALIGAGGHGKVVGEIAELLGYKISILVDDSTETVELFGLKSILLSEFLATKPKIPVALGVGNNVARERIFNELSQCGVAMPVLIHKSASVSKSASIGEGSVVMANAVINPSARIGRGVIVNSGAVVEHDNVIGDFVHISPRAALAGSVTIGAHTHIGIAACVIQGLTIGESCVIGAGSVVIDDILGHKTVVGNPAKRELI
ncbi:MAG: NeuD/PglB/VioB family sugar acetyltransferase [Wolinella sp.]